MKRTAAASTWTITIGYAQSTTREFTLAANSKAARSEPMGLSTGEFLQLDGTAQPGWGCSPNGLVGRTTEGALLSCQNGQWRAISANLQIVRAETTAYRWPHATARCPAGKKLMGGGGNCRSLGPPGMGWAVLVGSQPINETDWLVHCDTPERQNLMAKSWAICQ